MSAQSASAGSSTSTRSAAGGVAPVGLAAGVGGAVEVDAGGGRRVAIEEVEVAAARVAQKLRNMPWSARPGRCQSARCRSRCRRDGSAGCRGARGQRERRSQREGEAGRRRPGPRPTRADDPARARRAAPAVAWRRTSASRRRRSAPTAWRSARSARGRRREEQPRPGGIAASSSTERAAAASRASRQAPRKTAIVINATVGSGTVTQVMRRGSSRGTAARPGAVRSIRPDSGRAARGSAARTPAARRGHPQERPVQEEDERPRWPSPTAAEGRSGGRGRGPKRRAAWCRSSTTG